ncbi:MAG TPA: hypothetical protein VGE74_30065 [Gemmata sp.]
MNLLGKAREWLRDQVEAAAGEAITYTRGAQSFPLTALVGQVLPSESEEGAARIAVNERDYLISVAAFPFATPEIGDLVTQVIDGAELVFSVQSTNGGDPAWRHSDATRSLWLIHTKRKRA